jgi:Flp pilus assembly protein TadD
MNRTDVSELDIKDIAIAAFCASDFDKSLSCLWEAIERNPEDWEARIYLGLAYEKVGDRARSLRAFKYVSQNCQDELWQDRARLAVLSLSLSA